MSVGWIERRDFEDKHQGNAAQVDNFRTLKKYRQGIFGCSEKNKLAEMRNEVMKAIALKREATGKQWNLDKSYAKKKGFIERKKIYYKR